MVSMTMCRIQAFEDAEDVYEASERVIDSYENLVRAKDQLTAPHAPHWAAGFQLAGEQQVTRSRYVNKVLHNHAAPKSFMCVEMSRLERVTWMPTWQGAKRQNILGCPGDSIQNSLDREFIPETQSKLVYFDLVLQNRRPRPCLLQYFVLQCVSVPP